MKNPPLSVPGTQNSKNLEDFLMQRSLWSNSGRMATYVEIAMFLNISTNVLNTPKYD